MTNQERKMNWDRDNLFQFSKGKDMQIKFESKEHKDFFLKHMKECTTPDTYHQAFFYTLGINSDCRNHIHEVYDKKNDRIKPDGLYCGWQTSGSECATKLAFNLWNGFVEEGHEKDSTPYVLFVCEHAPYFFEAIKLRHPEYCKDRQFRNHEASER